MKPAHAASPRPPEPLEPLLVKWLWGPTSRARCTEAAERYWVRANQLLSMDLVRGPLDLVAVRVACHAWHLPTPAGRSPLARRAADAVAALTAGYPPACRPTVLARTVRLLDEVPERSPKLDEARVVADVVNLDDLGIAGLLRDAATASPGDPVTRLLARQASRDAYAYWPARLKTGFHFEASRRLAAEGIERARTVLRMLEQEIAPAPTRGLSIE